MNSAGGVTDTRRSGAGRAGVPGAAARRGRGKDFKVLGQLEWAQHVEAVVWEEVDDGSPYPSNSRGFEEVDGGSPCRNQPVFHQVVVYA